MKITCYQIAATLEQETTLTLYRKTVMKHTQATAVETSNYLDSPLQLTAFNDLEDELFGAVGTPERTEYEDRVALELLPKSIREYRKRNHLTQDELGARIGVQKSQISKLENDASNVTLATIRRVFQALDMSVQLVLKPMPLSESQTKSIAS